MNKGDLVLLKDLVIPAGTVFSTAANKVERFGEGHVETTIGLTDNSSGDVTYYVGDDKEELKEWFQCLV